MSFFAVNNLSAGYNGRNILNNISFQTENGSIVGVLGTNGSGKTTLLKAICSIINHTGSCILENKDISSLKPKKLASICAYIPQRSGIDIDISLLDVVCMGFNSRIGIFQQPTSEMKKQALNALNKVGLSQRADENYRSLSEGQKQLCIVARTLVSNARLFLLDEPESALDINYRYKIMALFGTMVKEQNSCVITALHDPNLALQWCDRLILLKNGEISDIIEPKKDCIIKMEKALSNLYGAVALTVCKDHLGNEHYVLLNQSEEFLCSLK